MRRDLPIGLIGAYLIHAAGESAAPRGAPLPKDTGAVALALPNEEALQRITERLQAAQIPFHPYREVGGDYDGQLMAVGLPPLPKEAVRRYVSDVPSLK